MVATTENTAFYEKSSATILAQQPSEVVVKQNKLAKQIEWNKLRSHLESRLAGLRTWRNSWWFQNWADLSQYLLPRRSTWLTQSTGSMPSPNTMTRGRPINTSIVDPTGTYALRVCAAGLMSGLASPSRPWFKAIPARQMVLDTAAREWLDEVEDRIYTVCAASNFYNSFAQECEDLVAFGTAPVIIYEDEEDVVRFYNPCVGEYFLSSSAALRVDGLYRTFVFTIAQIVDFFGLENCPQDIQSLWADKAGSLDQERIVAHSIEPNFAVDENEAGKIPGNFTWREAYWLYGANSDKPLSLRGFVSKPFTSPRWATQSNDAYGRSVGMDVLPDVLQLQVETRRKAEAIEKQVRPPLVADMSLKNQPSSILPGHVTYVQNLGPSSGMKPIYEVQPDIRGMMEDLQAIQQRIQKGFFNDLFLMLEQAPTAKMTAYEVAQKLQEKLNTIGPVIENIITESLKPRLKRVFQIMQKKGLIPPVPDSLKGIAIDVEFVSMLAVAQKATATGGLERIGALIGNMVAVYPEASDALNVDNFIDEMNDLLGNPEKILNGPEVRQQKRDARNQQSQQAQQTQAANMSADTVNTGAQAAQTLASTNIGAGNNVLAQMLGTGSVQ